MADRLVVEKSAQQRRIEGVLLYVMPPVVGLACRFIFGPGFWQIPAILIGFVILSLAGNAIAVRTGGELITPAERWRRSVARIAAASLWSLLLWMFAFYMLLMLSMLAPMASPRELRDFLTFMAPVIVVGAVIASALCVFYLRNQAKRIEEPEQTLEPQLPWVWLRSYAPLRVVTLIGIVIGYLAAREVPQPYNILVLLAGTWIGLIAESLIRSRRAKTSPVLWHNFGFIAALATGVVQHGFLFGIFFGLMGTLTSGKFDLPSLIFAAFGFIGGVSYTLVVWGVVKLNTVKAKAPLE